LGLAYLKDAYSQNHGYIIGRGGANSDEGNEEKTLMLVVYVSSFTIKADLHDI
jgi:hypothetical protein